MLDRNRSFMFLIAFMVLGILLAVQFRSTLYQNRQKAAMSLNIEKIKDRLNREKENEKQLKQQIDENLSKRDEFYKAYLEGKKDDRLWKEWEQARLKAGLTDVKGPGIILKLDDALARAATEDPRLLIIHDADIRFILNDLKKAGAQAISINGERIAPMSEQVCAGPTIRINRSRYAVPFVIQAVGNPDTLYNAMADSNSVIAMVRDKIRVDIKKSGEVVIPKFNYDLIDKLISRLEVAKDENK